MIADAFQSVVKWLSVAALSFLLYKSTLNQGSSSSPSHDGLVVYTSDLLKYYNGAHGRPIYLSVLGEVFDVTRGRRFYGGTSGYAGLVGRDASRAFVTGEFKAPDPMDHVHDLSDTDLLAVYQWQQFYERDYEHIGRLAGRYYNLQGQPTAYKTDIQQRITTLLQQQASSSSADKGKKPRDINPSIANSIDSKSDDSSTNNNDNNDSDTTNSSPPSSSSSSLDMDPLSLPACNVRWSQQHGRQVWCSEVSGGVERDWVGLPRMIKKHGETRCICVPDSLLANSVSTHTDINTNTNKAITFSVYPNCEPSAVMCQLDDSNLLDNGEPIPDKVK